MNKSKRLYDTEEASYYTKLSVEQLKKLRAQGSTDCVVLAPKFIKIGRLVRYPIEELDAFIDSFPRFEHLAQANDNQD